MFKVYDCDKLARYPEQNLHPSWNFDSFNSFHDAKVYANKYLGIYGPFPYNESSSFTYSGCEAGDCVIEIREE